MNREGTTFHLDLSSIGAEPLEPEDPRQIGAFPIRAVLGSGGMGRVYLGVAPDGYTAVKRVLPQLANDRTFLRHFGQELDNQARLPSGVSAQLLAADRTARPPWFATEYIPGVTLHDSVYLNSGSLPTDTVWILLYELATRLKAIAALDMVHRDLKPSNVMLTGSGVTLIDFGIARAADQSTVTATGMIVGTPAYMAPEQARAQKSLTAAVDVFSLGGVLAFAATGEPAFGGGSGTDLLFRIVHEAPDLDALRALDAELADVVESCLAKDPADRPSAGELAEIAAAHGQPGPPTWPTAIDQLITARRKFAQTAPGSDPPQAPDGPSTPETEFEEPGGDGEAGAGVGAGAWVGAGVAAVEVPDLEPDPAAAVDPDFVETVPVARERSEAAAEAAATAAKHEGVHRRRKAMASLLTLLLLVGTAGTLIAMHKVPFISSAGPNALGGGNLTPTGTGGWSSASSHASASSRSTAPAGSSTTSPKANPSSSSSAASGAGSGNSGSTAGTSGNNTGGTTTTTTSAAVTTHTSTSGSGGGGSGTSYATVVSTTDSEIENVAAQVCVSGFSGQGTRSCDGSSEAAFHEVSASGGFQLVTPGNLCLYNDYSTSSTVYAFSCDVLDSSTEIWTLGTRTSKGGELVNKGMCLAYSSAVQGGLTLASCNSSDSDQLWYDAGPA